MKRIQYKDLLEIKRPVLLFVEDHFGSFNVNDQFSKLRLLHPDGGCEYTRIVRQDWLDFEKSCFSAHSLKATVESMERFDKGQNINGIYLVDEL